MKPYMGQCGRRRRKQGISVQQRPVQSVFIPGLKIHSSASDPRAFHAYRPKPPHGIITFKTSLLKSAKTKFVKKFRKSSSSDAGSASSTPTTSTVSMEASGSSQVSSSGDSESTQLLDSVPTCPPPSYEHVLAESALENGQLSRDQIEEENEANSKQVVVVHKSSKKLYRALAAQLGITCKMSDQCPCFDCQGHYFDCEYDRDNENEKTDGGLGAGTPVFISTVMHGSACTIL